GTDETAMDFRRLLPEIRWQSRLSPDSGTGSPDWFFAPIGMGLRPATFHEQPSAARFGGAAPPLHADQGVPYQAGFSTLPPGDGALRGLTRLPWISGAFCRKFAGSPVCLRFPGPAPRIGLSTQIGRASCRGRV